MRDIHKMDQRPEGLGGERREKGREGKVTQLPRGRELADGAQKSMGSGGRSGWLRFVLCLSFHLSLAFPHS